jgi:hypothetical protein
MYGPVTNDDTQVVNSGLFKETFFRLKVKVMLAQKVKDLMDYLLVAIDVFFFCLVGKSFGVDDSIIHVD